MAEDKKEFYQNRIDEYEGRARSTGNLVYVWMAISQAHAGGLPMPEWCYGQVAHWAISLYELAHLLDPDQEFKRRPDEDDESFGERLHTRWSGGGEISAEEATEKAKAIFGFSGRQGWNAFRSVMADEEAIKNVFVDQAAQIHLEITKQNAVPLSEAAARKKYRDRAKATNLLGKQMIPKKQRNEK